MKADEDNPTEEPKTLRKQVRKNISQRNTETQKLKTEFDRSQLTEGYDTPRTFNPIQTSSSVSDADHLTKIFLGTNLSETKISSVDSNSDFQMREALQDMPAFGELIFEANSTPNQSNSKPNKDHLYKVLVIGDLGAGKTSIIKRYVHDFFSQHYRATIGVDFALKVLHWDENTFIRLQLWDIAGQERYGNMTRVYYKGAVGAFIVFDVTRANTFESVSNWKADLDAKAQLPDGSRIPCVLLGNKCDQEKEGIINNPSKMQDFCEEKGFTSWFETSAKENINIEEAGKSLIRQMLQNDAAQNYEENKDNDQFQLTSKDHTTDKKKCYKC